MRLPSPASIPTLYFIGVTTQQSSIMDVFPRWAEILGLEAQLVGIDLPLHAPADHYREVVEFIKDDPLSRGALVTTHKINILEAARDLFDRLDGYAQVFGEVSCISKDDTSLVASAKDPITSGLAMEAFIPQGFWEDQAGHVLLLGCGGSSRAILAHLCKLEHGNDRPARAVASDVDPVRAEELQSIMDSLGSGVPVTTAVVEGPEDNAGLLEAAPPHSLVVNATGLGKDRPGSPLAADARFPKNSFVWELNYRGSLEFMHQAAAQADSRNLHVEDGWTYFIHGWTQVIAEVFAIGDIFPYLPQLSAAAQHIRRQR